MCALEGGMVASKRYTVAEATKLPETTPSSFPLSNIIDTLPTILISNSPDREVILCLEVATRFTDITVISKIARLKIHASKCTPAVITNLETQQH